MTTAKSPAIPRRWLAAGAVLVVLSGLGTAAHAQRDPVYASARASGQIGEKTDGYLGFVGSPSADVKRVVDDLNIKRRALYSERASASNATVEEFAFTSGCRLILQTVPGEKYQAPDGSWQTRGAAAPLRDNRCP